MATTDDDQVYVASRVQQLDAEILDNEVFSLLKSQLRTVLNYLSEFSSTLRDFEPELELAIKFYVWKWTVWNNSRSIGQEMLQLRLFDSKSFTSASNSQLIGLGISSFVIPYAIKRFGHFWDAKIMERVETTIKGLNLLSFVVFLAKGSHRNVQERVLSLNCGYESLDRVLNPVSFDYMSRELLWFTFAEFLSFALPLINIQKVKNTINRAVFPKSNSRTHSKLIKPSRSEKDLKNCAICNKLPTNVREIGCNHVFCYFCVMSNFLADPDNGFNCPICNHCVSNPDQIREVQLKGF